MIAWKKDMLSNCILELMRDANLIQLDKFIQHGDTTCFWHSIAIAYYSLAFVDFMHIHCNVKSLIIGALLHDYYLYDWHIKDASHRLHGFTHGKKALNNAEKVRKLNKLERDIIKKHMFPLTPLPPIYRESIVVCLVDKACSLYETFCRDTYKSLRQQFQLL